ncbi:MAG: hypothetical protein KDB61_00485 [Planctomycetes bacterium]|nr:hypothetical protein [Planctomycetota bacterium]
MTQARHSQRTPRLFHHWDRIQEFTTHSAAAEALMTMILGIEDLESMLCSHLEFPDSKVSCTTGVTYRIQSKNSDRFTEFEPDGLLEFHGDAGTIRALLVVCVGASKLNANSVKLAHRLAKQEGFDAVLAIGNQPPTELGRPPVALNRELLRRIPVHYLTWDTIFQNVQDLVLAVDNQAERWLMTEWLAFMDDTEHPITVRHGMGPHWNGVVHHARAGTLNIRDEAVFSVAHAWRDFLNSACKRLGAMQDLDVSILAPKEELADDDLHSTRIATRLVNHHALSGRLTGCGLEGPLEISLYPGSSTLRISTDLPIPEAANRQKSLLRLAAQLKRVNTNGEDSICTHWDQKSHRTCCTLDAFLQDALSAYELPDGRRVESQAQPVRIRLERAVALSDPGSTRSAGLLDELFEQVNAYYLDVVAGLRTPN